MKLIIQVSAFHIPCLGIALSVEAIQSLKHDLKDYPSGTFIALLVHIYEALFGIFAEVLSVTQSSISN
jgi:hypothetical protein